MSETTEGPRCSRCGCVGTPLQKAPNSPRFICQNKKRCRQRTNKKRKTRSRK